MTADRLGVAALTPVGLQDVVESAALMRRVDRKYLVPLDTARTVVAALAGSHQVLDIGGRRTTGYLSTYFDSADLVCCRDHLQGRRLRWKVRRRTYVEDSLQRFEIKVKAGRGDTVKHSIDVRDCPGTGFTDDESRLLGEVLGTMPSLRPTLEVAYTRATLADLASGTRVTVDLEVTGRSLPPSTALAPGSVGLHASVALVETKGSAGLAEADRLLLRLGHRPRPLSKYVSCAALLSDRLPRNDLHALQRKGLLTAVRQPSGTATVAEERRAS